MNTDLLYRVTAPHFVAGLVVRDGIIIQSDYPLDRENTLFSEFYRFAGWRGWAVEKKD